MTSAILLAVLALAFANGANDNLKGVATLYGTRLLSYRRALVLATLTTFAGSLAGLALATGLARRFSGRGLVPDAVAGEPGFVLAVAVGAGAALALATRLGLPVSTTHALTGALVGAGVVGGAERVSFAGLTSSFLAPLALSPLLAMLLAAGLRAALRRAEARSRSGDATCVCAAPALAPGTVGGSGVEVGPALARIRLGTVEVCQRHGATPVVTFRAADLLHLASAGAVGFARGLNDTPKIAGLFLAADVLSPQAGTIALAVAMAAGGWLAARRVAATVAYGITAMDGAEGLGANLVTAGLVVVASPLGLPVSTTHVSCGALFGIGAASGRARWRTIGTIVAAWLTTLPAGAALAALASAGIAAIR
jgi:PiT family inorganic phosphate transporter